MVIAGPLSIQSASSHVSCNLATTTRLETQLEKFWAIEEVPGEKPQTLEEKGCEKIFSATTRRSDNGHFVVQLPAKRNSIILDTVESAKCLKKDLTHLLSAYGFPLRKWLSNSPEVLEPEDEANSPIYHVIDCETRKMLGVHWCAKTDTLNYSVNPDDFNLSRVTKRTILSAVSTIFDPLGTITPITIKAKLLIQELWKAQVGWDSPIPQSVAQMWNDFIQNLAQLNVFSLPRQVTVPNACQTELHAFCDASQKAYGACIYLRTISPQGITVRLLCSKSRVAPLKTITLPRLELSGALLMAQLVHRVQGSLKMTLDRICYWTDSTIVLAWIAAPPSSWKLFVANRVAEIQRMTDINNWRHVQSQDNPADLVSRGMDINKAHSCMLWWHGPSWLIQDQASWPRSKVQEEQLPDRRKTHTSLVSQHVDPTILAKYSTLYKLQKVVSYCLRFIHNASHKATRQTGPITNQDPSCIDKNFPSTRFPTRIELFSPEKGTFKKSPIKRLDPFIDSNGCLRVGGRLHNSNLPYDAQHPIILSSKSQFTLLLIRQEHHRQLHAGPQTLLASLRQKFWPLGGLNTIKEPLLTFPQPDFMEVPTNRYPVRVLQQSMQRFWSRWSSDYLHQLQTRTSGPRQIYPSITLEKRAHHPVAFKRRWTARTATILTARGNVTRAVQKVAVLPVDTKRVPDEEIETSPTTFQGRRCVTPMCDTLNQLQTRSTCPPADRAAPTNGEDPRSRTTPDPTLATKDNEKL
nr:unnamed protein product [Callosobruchus chinensis]